MTQAETDPSKTNPQAPDNGVRPPAAAPGPARTPFYRTPAFLAFMLFVLGLGIAGRYYWLHARHFEETDDAFIDGQIIPIGPQVPAQVVAVHMLDNQFVHKGELLVELDPASYRIALAQAQGMEAAAQGKLMLARANVVSAQSSVTEFDAELVAAKVNLDNADRNLRRFENLDVRAKSQQQLDNASTAQQIASAQVEEAKARLASARNVVTATEASVVVADGDYHKALADTSRAQLNLSYCNITAPSDGRVTSKTVDAGMYVTTASQLFLLVPADVWVTANFKETQLTHMEVGQKVTIKVDAYPTHDYQGTVQSIQAGTGSRFSIIPSENATGNFVKVVQRVPVKILFDDNVNSDDQHILAPGMSVEPKVRISEGNF